MSEEEKKAIEYLKSLYWYAGEEELEDNINIVLTLIYKQQKEIEELKFKYQVRKDRTKNNMISKDKIREIFNKYEKLDCITIYDFSNFADDIKKLLEE